MDVVTTVFGFLVIAAIGYDIFHQLVHPSGKGRLSHWITMGVWRLFRVLSRSRPSRLALAGPVAFVTVVLSWAVLLVVGWALIYWPRMPGDFVLSDLEPAQASSFVHAMYYSLVTLATLGYGDIVPEADWLRLVAVAQAAVGFVLWSAAITWLLSLYPAISRGRLTAYLISEYLETGVLERGDSSLRAQALLELAGRLASYRSDLSQMPLAYFFFDSEAATPLPVGLPALYRLTGRLTNEAQAGSVPPAARTLHRAIDAFAATLAQSFLRVRSPSTEEILVAYAADHCLEQKSSAAAGNAP